LNLEELTAAKLSSLPYLNAVLNESMEHSYCDLPKLGFRITPVVSTGLRREIPKDCTIGGYHVPAGVRNFSTSTDI
jgi:cytochrome P450